jgi:hypothetical protein
MSHPLALTPPIGATWSRSQRSGRLPHPWIVTGAAVALAAALTTPLTQSHVQQPNATLPGRVPVGSPTPTYTAASGLAGLLSLPLDKQFAFNALLGSSDSAFHVRPDASGPAVTSPTYGFDASFGPAGPTWKADASTLGLSLVGIGYGAAVDAITPVAPDYASNEVNYRHPGVTETYTHGPLGLAQSITLAQRPSRAGSYPLTLSMQITGGATVRVGSNSTSAEFVDNGQTLGRYRGLIVTDADDKVVPAQLAGEGTALQIRVDERDARYPLTIDPFVYAGYGQASYGYGWSTAIVELGSGTWYLAGSPKENSNTGAVHLLFDDGSDEVTGSVLGAQSGAEFGYSVAAVAENFWDTPIIVAAGSPFRDVNGKSNAGAVTGLRCSMPFFYLMSCNSGTTLIASDGDTDDNLGVSVGVSTAVETVTYRIFVGGSPNDNFGTTSNTGSGRVWVNPAWASVVAHNASLAPPSPGTTSNQWAGSSIAISDAAGGTCNGHSCRTVVVGAPGSGTNAGKALIFEEPSNGWENQSTALQATRALSGGSGDYLGYAVSINANGTVVAAGAPLNDQPLADQGSVEVATRAGSSWTLAPSVVTLTDGAGGAGDRFGSSVSLAKGGSAMAVGAPLAETIQGNGEISDEGIVQVFNKPVSGWATTSSPSELIFSGSGEAVADHFGHAVDMSDDGNNVMTGLPDNTTASGDVGGYEVHNR